MSLSSRRSLAVLLCALVIAALAAAGPHASTAAAQAPDPKEQCKNGGYAGFVDPSTGAPFRNQGQCVSHVNKGGALVPVATPTPTPTPTPSPTPAPLLPDLTTEVSCTTEGTRKTCLVTLRNIGQGPAFVAANTDLMRSTATGFSGHQFGGGYILPELISAPAGFELRGVSSYCNTSQSACTRTDAIRSTSDQVFAPGDTVVVRYTGPAHSMGVSAVADPDDDDATTPAVNRIPETNEDNNRS